LDGIKILLVGPSGVGKTTLRKIFFDQANPIQLLAETLEPTRGVETSLYNFGGNVAIFDLAGQQMEDFLSTSSDIFAETDLILLVLDSTESEENNNELWQKIEEIRQINCPEAYLSIFFHKADLLSTKNQKKMESKIRVLFSGITNASAYLTSIEPHFFFKMYQSFVSSLKAGLFRLGESIPKDFFIKLEIMSQFIEKNEETLENLISTIGVDSDLIQENLRELEAKGYIFLKDSSRRVALSQIGQYIIQRAQSNVYLKMQECLSAEVEFVKAFILSDTHGRNFVTFESEPDYIQKYSSDDENNPDATLISMFFSAIGSFGESFDAQGFSTIQLTGKNVQIIAQSYGDVLGIFFISNIPIDPALLNVLRQFMRDIYAEYYDIFQKFILTGNLALMTPFQDEFILKLRNINNLLRKLAMIQRQISRERFAQLYEEIQTQGCALTDIDAVRNLCFNRLVTDDPSIIDEIFTFIENQKDEETH